MGLLLSTSATRRARTCCSSSTTSSGSPRLVLRCLPCSVVSPLLSVTSPLWPLTWVPCRSVSPPPRRDPSHLCRPSTCPLTTWLTPPLPPPSLTWTPPLCCPVVLPSVASTPPSTPSTPPPVSWTPTSSELSTTELPVMSRSCCRTTSPSRISLPSWVWTSCLRRTRSRSRGRGRLRGSCPSPSRSLRCSPTTLASSSPLPRPSPDSRKSLLASSITCPRVPSTWLATLTRLWRRLRSCLPKLPPTKKQAAAFRAQPALSWDLTLF